MATNGGRPVIGDEFDETIGRARAGDAEAVEVLYCDTVPLVTGYARAQGSRQPDDVTSDVFVAMVRGLPRFQGDERGFRSWLLTIAHRRVADEHRRTGRRPTEVTLDDVDDERSRDADTETDAIARLRAQGVLRAMDDLTEDQRSVLLLRVLADLPIAQISTVVAKPETAVKALLRRGLERLRHQLDGRPDER